MVSVLAFARSRSPVIATAVAVVVVLSSCSEINPFEASSPASTVSNGALTSHANEADVAFLESMIVHLRSGQVLAASALDLDAAAADELVQLARHVTDEDASRITQMVELLEDWGRSAPASSEVPDPVEALDGLSGPGFDDRWVELMLDHHAQAVVLAEAAQRDGVNREVNNLASGMLVDLGFEMGRLGAVFAR
ncbi:MAG: DUF305 domain-containing protein [Acidimicrobiia bacterium]|nr:DUF305 domain-containing protein [Acidimicrobiia bacterium]